MAGGCLYQALVSRRSQRCSETGDKRVRDATPFTGMGLMRGAAESAGPEASFPPRDAGQGRAVQQGSVEGRGGRRSTSEAPEEVRGRGS